MTFDLEMLKNSAVAAIRDFRRYGYTCHAEPSFSITENF
jgi:hypothetical protein